MDKHAASRALALLLALLCLAFAGCGRRAGEPEVPGEEIAGADWRTWGTVQAAGTIVRGGEETDVLVCLYRDEAVFYYDDESETPYDRVEYPAPMEDAQSAFQSISFEDLNGDGDSDVTLSFDGDGVTVLVWYWDAAEGYVLQPDAAAAE